MFGIIYKVTSPSGKVYIGQTTNTLKKRIGQHACRVKKGDRRATFQLALYEEGFTNFIWEQLDIATTADELDKKEIYWIAHFDSMNPAKGYNNQSGGIHYVPSTEHRQRLSFSVKGEKNASAKITEETARKVKTDLIAGMRICEAVRKYRLKSTTIENIKYGKSWAWIDVCV